MQDNYQFRRLFDGPIDIVGDIHGELGALAGLLGHLGYSAAGEHPQGRRLVFIGDLCDRGVNSPGVVAFVRELAERRLAQCVLGNHELNVLRGARKEGNGWFFEEDHDRAEGKFLDSRAASPTERAAILAFFADLPLVLERPDLRLVHAAWDDAALGLLQACRAPTMAVYKAYAARASDIARESGLAERADEERRAHCGNLGDPAAEIPLLENMGRLDAHYQMANPVRIVTSGPETLTREPFFAAGKWRMLERVKWWNNYRHDTPVLIGHYWRWPTRAAHAAFTRGERDLFDGVGPNAWHGQRRNVFCLDFGVGARYKERALGRHANFQTRLGAVRWPERELVFDDGERLSLQ